MLSVRPKLQLLSFSGTVGTISRTDAACAVLLRQLTLDETLCALRRCQTFFLAFDFECDLGLGLVFLFQPRRENGSWKVGLDGDAVEYQFGP